MQFHPMNAGLQKPSLSEVKRPDGQVNVSEPAEVYPRHVAADRKVFADLELIRSFAPITVPDSYSLAHDFIFCISFDNRSTIKSCITAC
jgi:hypothetical protein